MLHAPVLGDDGLLYVSTVTQEIIAVDTSARNVKWREVIEGKMWNPPLLTDEVLYFGTDKNKAYALNAQTGETAWVLDSSSAIIGTPVVLADQIAFATEGGEVFTTTPDGTRVWPRTITGKLYSTLSISPDLMAVGGLELENLLVTFTPSGNQGWTYNPPSD
jgi:outer membrane protein assembly factor BamB